MALVLKDRVKVTTTTTGTGAFAIGGAQFGFQGFSAFANGDTTYYTAVDNATGDWETGLGTYSAAGPSLARTQVLASSTGTAINFGAGPKDLFVVYPASRAVLTDGAVLTGPLSVPAGASGAQVPQAQEVLHHTFPSGTKMLFAQTAAPAGWTKDTTHDNKALRIVSGTAGSGGSVGFTTAFASQAVSGTVGNTTLTTEQMPSHGHAVSDPGHSHGSQSYRTASGSVQFGGTGGNMGNGSGTSSAGTGISIAANGSGGAHNHTFTGTAIDLAVQYVDAIICTKN